MTTASGERRRHRFADGLARLHREVDQLAETALWSADERETEALLTAVTALRGRVTELELRVAAQADRIELGARHGATSASWWARQTRQTRAAAHRRMRLARRLDADHEPVADALAAGELREEQAEVIVNAVDALPADLVEPELVAKARAQLIHDARDHDAKALRILGRRILDVVAPEVGEEHERRVLLREERDGRAAARFTMFEDGHGRSHGRFTLPTLQAEMLRKTLTALASPKHGTAAGDADPPHRPMPERMGRAFMEYVEAYPSDRLPDAGGVPASLVVTVSLESLLSGLGSAELDTGGVISADEARRLACRAGIIPAVLGGKSQVLDLGRSRRLHTRAQRLALGVRDRGCTAEGCDWPPGMCHAHHDRAWSRGGPTNVDSGRLLCPRHHARAHDPAFTMAKRPGGKVAFTRRT